MKLTETQTDQAIIAAWFALRDAERTGVPIDSWVYAAVCARGPGGFTRAFAVWWNSNGTLHKTIGSALLEGAARTGLTVPLTILRMRQRGGTFDLSTIQSFSDRRWRPVMGGGGVVGSADELLRATGAAATAGS